MKVIIPAAGLGTRMLPLTRYVPKEMLPFGMKPVIQHILGEAFDAGFRKAVIVISKAKEVIRRYFSLPSRVEMAHHESQQDVNESVLELEKLVREMKISFVYQKKLDGIAGALCAARKEFDNEPFVMMIPDQLFFGRKSALSQILQHYCPDGPVILSSLVKIPRDHLKYFQGARGFRFNQISEYYVNIEGIATEAETRKSHEDSDFEIRGFGRTILPPEIFDFIRMNIIDEKSGEIDYPLCLNNATREIPHYGVLLDDGIPCDIGTLPGYGNHWL